MSTGLLTAESRNMEFDLCEGFRVRIVVGRDDNGDDQRADWCENGQSKGGNGSPDPGYCH